MATDQAVNQALHGLDSLESAPGPARREPGPVARRAWAATWPKLLAIALVLAVWELVALSGWKHYVLQGPAPVLANLWSQLRGGQLWGAIGNTLQTAAVGYGVALVIGSVAGLLVARIPPLRAAVGSIITALQTMPSVAWVPFAIVIFGPSNTAILFVVILGAAPSIANGLITGIDYTPPLLLRAGQTMGLRGFALYRYLIMPASLPAFVAGMKQGWAFAWRSLMAGEIVVPIIGHLSIGQLLSTDQSALDFTSTSAVLIVILVVGILVDTIFTKADLSLRRRRGLLDASAGA
jgi:NitT/TauT family transport system permease protein